MKHADALKIANSLLDALAPYCERIEIAGSVRRGKPEVKDIELVAIPKIESVRDMFGLDSGKKNLLIAAADSLGVRLKGGERYLQISLPQGINLDLFMVTPPAQWGVQFVIRTGPAGFSHWLVTPRRYGGALPAHLSVRDGALLDSTNAIVPTPEETDVFGEIGIEYIEPAERVAPAGFEV